MAELSDLQLSASQEKKKRKRERLLNAKAASRLPRSSDDSFVFSGHDEEGGDTRKKKKKERREASESQLDGSCVSMESEITSEVETGVLIHKKKKKKKHVPIAPGDGELCFQVSQEKTSGSPRTDFQENLGDVAHVDEGTPVKKKKSAKALFTERAEANSPNPSKWSQTELAVAEMAELSDLQLSASQEKKKRKRERLLNAKAASRLPRSSDDSFVFSAHDEEGGNTRKKKKKERREASESQLDGSCVSVESEITSEVETGVLIHKKKKKKKHVPIAPGDGELCFHASQEKTSGSPRTDFQENLGDVAHVDEGTPVKKKKRAKALFTERAEANSPNPSKLGQTEPSSPEDTQEELFASSPLTQIKHSSLSFKGKKKRATHLDILAELDSPLTQKKSCKMRKRKRSCTDVSYTASGLATEEGVDNTNHDSLRPGSSPKQGASEGNNGSANSPTLVYEAEEELSPSGHSPSRAEADCSLIDNPFLKFSEISKMDLATVTQELEEFIPHARNLSASAIKKLAERDLIRFKNFKREGVAVKFGKFSQKENEQLEKNVEAFLEVNGIDNAEKLFFPDRFPEETLAINKLKAEQLFGVRIAEGIPRPWRLVYYRARKMYDSQNCKKVYSRKEIQKLRKYQAIYGNNWKKISELMHRSSHSVQLKYSQIKSKPNFGPWSKQEIKQLIQAVGEIIRSKEQGLDSTLEQGDADKALSLIRKHLYRGISWTQVEAKVGTRHWRQCKQKWIYILTKRMSRGKLVSHGRKNLRVKINLIERMHELNIEDANEIDWEDLSSAIGNVPPDYVQTRFYRLKAQHVPNWNYKSFSEIIDSLYEVTLPKFKDRLMDYEKTKISAARQAGDDQKKTYRFSDIFWLSDVEDEDEDEDEEEEEKEKEQNLKLASSEG